VVWYVGQSHAFSNYICLYSKFMWHGRTQWVFIAPSVHVMFETVTALCWVDSSLQNLGEHRWVWYNKHCRSTLNVGFIYECVLPAQRPVLSWKVRIPSILGNIYDTFPIGTWPDTTRATYTINLLVFITEMKSVYSAVRTESLNKAVCYSSLKG
jgi:hypothetical protein